MLFFHSPLRGEGGHGYEGTEEERQHVGQVLCQKEKVNGPEEGTVHAGRNSVFPVMALRIAAHPECRVTCAFDKFWVMFPSFVKNFKGMAMFKEF